MATPFETIIDCFMGKITDDMYLELTYEDTLKDAKLFLLDAIPYFEFPRFALYDYDLVLEQYNVDLTREEINIFALLMKTAWLERQINSVENTRMKYSGSDFKMTSQANHLSKLLQLKSENVREATHAQRLYKRRKFLSNGQVESNWSVLNTSTFDDTSVAPPTVPSGGSSSGGNNNSNNNNNDNDNDNREHNCNHEIHIHNHINCSCDCDHDQGDGDNNNDDDTVWEPIKNQQVPQVEYLWEPI